MRSVKYKHSWRKSVQVGERQDRPTQWAEPGKSSEWTNWRAKPEGRCGRAWSCRTERSNGRRLMRERGVDWIWIVERGRRLWTLVGLGHMSKAGAAGTMGDQIASHSRCLLLTYILNSQNASESAYVSRRDLELCDSERLWQQVRSFLARVNEPKQYWTGNWTGKKCGAGWP